MRITGYLLTIGAFLCAALPTVSADPARVIVVANRNVPESVDLAHYYLKARDIPAENLCILDLPTGEQMSRHDYNLQLRDPLLSFLRDGTFITQSARPPNEVEFHETAWITTESRVDYIVLMYGIPLRVGDTRFRLVTRVTDRLGHPRFKNMASVDSEVALLLARPYDIAGPLPNPMFNQLSTSRMVAEDNYVVVTTRLDGPNPDVVRAMVDGALFAERYGLLGRMYFDARGIKSGPYYVGDYWIREAEDRFQRAGFETVIDLDEAVWPIGYPMEHAILYFGWYTEHIDGPFTRDDFAFASGGVAYHIHSASAISLRRKNRYWAGPVLSRGASVSMGAVSEPFLTFTPDLKVFTERLIYGYSFGEAAYMATSALSWQMTFVGDPLYRPFRLGLAEQMANLRADNRPEIEWGHVRHANLLIQQGRFNPALQYLRARIRESDSHVLRERLADLYALNDLLNDAGQEYGYIIQHTDSVVTAARTAGKWMDILRRLNQDDQANRLRSSLLTKWGGDHPAMQWLQSK